MEVGLAAMEAMATPVRTMVMTASTCLATTAVRAE
jgi:hypothetical protein